MDNDILVDDDFVFYSLLYSSITVVFAMAVLSKFLTNEFRFGFRSLMSLGLLFTGEPVCHLLLKGAAGVILFGVGCLFVYSILPASHLPATGKTVLITGCDSGFGQELAKKLDSLGMQVFAGCLHRNGPGALKLQHSCSSRVKLLQLDVTNNTEVQQAFDFISQQVTDEGLWGLVNNAGTCYLAEVELTPETVFRKILEVNLMGTIRMTKTFLPLIRQSKGRIVNTSSVSGRVPASCLAAYGVSKAGMECFSDVLRVEMQRWGVKVAIVEPAGFKTDAVELHSLNEKKEYIWDNLDEKTKAVYGRKYFDKSYENFEAALCYFPTDLSPVVRAMRSGLLSMKPRQRYYVGRGAGTLVTVFPFLPVWLADKIIFSFGFANRELNPAGLQNN
ncbi:hypothetical protein NP493_402g00026 [Ridgeia piscesae]|uniref:Estradiol 17-beta-dehydrogenase 2 n=1 Tax=Ridgeia piscesae TaxID=27915 RepID=A0AAD9L207_RIDPI|nr:hypothetical protein NP493_402g00026 [Ridgeia piscesae]